MILNLSHIQVKLVLSDPNNVEFRQSLPQSAKLFFKYQEAIHKDPPEKCTEKRVITLSNSIEIFKGAFLFQCKIKALCAFFTNCQYFHNRIIAKLAQKSLSHWHQFGVPPEQVFSNK